MYGVLKAVPVRGSKWMSICNLGVVCLFVWLFYFYFLVVYFIVKQEELKELCPSGQSGWK